MRAEKTDLPHVARRTPGVRVTAKAVTLEEVQSLVTSGLAKLPQATFLLLHRDGNPPPKDWLRWIASQTAFSTDPAKDRAVNVAFTHQGLRAMGLEPAALAGFPTSFREGMTGGR